MWLDVSQDPAVGNNQSKAQFWQRIIEDYHSKKPSSNMSDRNVRSVQCRMQLIHRDCKKFNGCLRQIELMHPSGANEQIIMQRANELFTQMKGYEDGFKFDHVWPILKEYLEVQAQAQSHIGVSSDLDENMREYPNSPNSLTPPFNVNLSDDNNFGGSSSSQRPEGVKKSKLKRKQDEEMSNFLQSIKGENEKFHELFKNSAAKSDRGLDVLQKKIEAEQEKNRIRQQVRDDNIMLINPDSIEDLERRASIRSEQQLIMQKRRQAHMTNTSNVFDMFGQFPNLGGSGSGLSEY
ncbi:hypothetical protein ACS0TY_023813 [Phlomoides rotata]